MRKTNFHIDIWNPQHKFRVAKQQTSSDNATQPPPLRDLGKRLPKCLTLTNLTHHDTYGAHIFAMWVKYLFPVYECLWRKKREALWRAERKCGLYMVVSEIEKVPSFEEYFRQLSWRILCCHVAFQMYVELFMLFLIEINELNFDLFKGIKFR